MMVIKYIILYNLTDLSYFSLITQAFDCSDKRN